MPTSATLYGPHNGTVSVASTDFIIMLDQPAPAGGVTCSITDLGSGDTITSTPIFIAENERTGTFTITAETTGSRTITLASATVVSTSQSLDVTDQQISYTAYTSGGNLTNYYLFSASPPRGRSGDASTNFSLQQGDYDPHSSAIPTPITITPNDSGAGGTFFPTEITLAPALGVETFTYTPPAINAPDSPGTITISVTSNRETQETDPSPVTYQSMPRSTALALYAPSPAHGHFGMPSDDFVVVLGTGGSSTPVTITPNDSGAGGLFIPAAVTLTTSSPTKSFAYIPASVGTIPIAITSGVLTDPSSVNYRSIPQYSVFGPSSGIVDVESATFTITFTHAPDTSTVVTITPSGGGLDSGDSFTRTFGTSTTTQTFTITPPSTGVVILTFTNDSILDDPLPSYYGSTTLQDVTQTWLDGLETSDPYQLETGDITYKLQDDVTTNYSSFWFRQNNITLDLNGHTITYDNNARIVVANGNFEDGDLTGWDTSVLGNAPDANVVTAYLMPWATYMCSVGPFNGTQTLVSSDVVIPTAGIKYVASLTHYSSQDGTGITLTVKDGSTVLGSHTGNPKNGSCTLTEFTPSSTNSIKLWITVDTGGHANTTISFSYVQVMRGSLDSGSYKGVIIGNKSHCSIISSAPGGTITQGQARSYKAYPVDCDNATDATIAGTVISSANSLNISVNGEDTSAVYANYANGLTVLNTTFSSSIDQISNRMALYCFIYMMNNAGSAYIDGNNFSGTHQSCIVYSGQRTRDSKATFVVTNNTSTHSSAWTDGYCCEMYGHCTNFEIANNTFTPTYGRGILFDTDRDDGIRYGRVHDNTCVVQERGDLEYGTTGLEPPGIRMRNYSGVIRNVMVYDNLFYGHTTSGLAHEAIGGRFNLWNGYLSPPGAETNANIVFITNTFKGIALSAGVTAAGLDVSYAQPMTGTTFIDNTCESNNVSLRFGSNDGNDIRDLEFISNIIKKSGDGVSMDYESIDSGSINNSYTDDIRLIDMSYTNGATEGFVFGGFGVDKNLTFGWLLNLTVTNTTGGVTSPVAGAIVTITDTNGTGTIKFTGLTDSNGQCFGIHLLSDKYTSNGADNSTPGSGSNQYPTHVSYNDFLISASKSPWTGSTSVTMDSSKSVTLAISSGG